MSFAGVPLNIETTRAAATQANPRSEAPIYLDYQSTTPTDPRVVAVMLPYFSEIFANPHSNSHARGIAARDAVETARAQIASLIGAEAREIVFTSGATEANNLTLKGLARFGHPGKDHIVTCATEHKCVLESCRALAREGFSTTFLPVDRLGHIDLDQLRAAINARTLVVSIMAVNNEIGVIAPLQAIGAICREHGVFFHTDAAQAVGKIPLDAGAMHIDLMSISGHKAYGPKGIGALYVRRRPRVRLEPLFSGGGQERGLRSGTLPTPLCVGLGEACRIAAEEMTAETARLLTLRTRLAEGLLTTVPELRINGDLDARIAGNLNISVGGVDGEMLLASLKDLCVSSGSACTSAAIEPSYVLRAIGHDAALASASLRIGLGRFTTADEIEIALASIIATVRRLRGNPDP